MAKWILNWGWLQPYMHYPRKGSKGSVEYFIHQSEQYAYWWRNFDWWPKDKKNPIYEKKWNNLKRRYKK